MAWTPPPLPPTRSNSTPQLDNHAADHNLLSGALQVILPTAWSTASLLNGWTNWGAPYQPCQYRLVADMVQVRGIIKGGTATPGTILFYLPSAPYRPPASLQFPCESANAYAAVEVKADGSVNLKVGSNGALSLQFQFSTAL